VEVVYGTVVLDQAEAVATAPTRAMIEAFIVRGGTVILKN
jgi:hypothetical protein